MKELQAIIQEFRVSQVVDALEALPGIGGITVVGAQGFGHQRGREGLEEHARGSVNFVRKALMFIVDDDAAVDEALETIRKNAHTGNPGDGKVFVIDVLDALRIRTGDRGSAAL